LSVPDCAYSDVGHSSVATIIKYSLFFMVIVFI
jgi:hypothetical protein